MISQNTKLNGNTHDKLHCADTKFGRDTKIDSKQVSMYKWNTVTGRRQVWRPGKFTAPEEI